MAKTLKNSTLIKILALLGTLFAWFPILATIVTGLFVSIRSRMLHVDYLMPAELFPSVIVGGIMLLCAALMARTRRGIIGWSLLAAVGLLVASQALAVATGLASGETEPAGWQWSLVVALLGGYVMAVILMGAGGLLLLRTIFRK